MVCVSGIDDKELSNMTYQGMYKRDKVNGVSCPYMVNSRPINKFEKLAHHAERAKPRGPMKNFIVVSFFGGQGLGWLIFGLPSGPV